MYDVVSTIEEGLIKVESWALVACLLAMLLLAGYNIFYRNALISLQIRLQSSGPPVSQQSTDSEREPRGASDGSQEESDDSSEGDDSSGGFGGGFGGGGDGDSSASADESGGSDGGGDGFQGGFGSDDDSSASNGDGGSNTDAETDDGGDSEGGFEGGFGGGGTSDESSESSTDDSSASNGDEGGFQGGFGGEEGSNDKRADSNEDESGGFGGGFGGGDEGGTEENASPSNPNTPSESESGGDSPSPSAEVGGPPPKGSWAAWAVDAIDAIKLTWIDILLRQLVLIVGFLGALIATRRREHITIDIAHQIAEGRTREILDAITSLFAGAICVVLALSGSRLVGIGLKWPSELIPGVQEWTFQLMFPIGFGLMALHFALRSFESGWRAATGRPLGNEPPEASTVEGAPDSDDEEA